MNMNVLHRDGRYFVTICIAETTGKVMQIDSLLACAELAIYLLLSSQLKEQFPLHQAANPFLVPERPVALEQLGQTYEWPTRVFSF